MKLSCLPVSFFDDIIAENLSVPEWAAMGKRLGLDAIDVSILFIKDYSSAALLEMRRKIEDTGMSITMVASYPDFTHPDKAQRERELELEKQVVEVSATLGAKYVRVTAGQAHPETPVAYGIEWATEGMLNLAQQMAGTGVTLLYENHAKPGAWQYTDFSQPPEIFLDIVNGTAGSPICINFDTGNAAAFAENPVGLLQTVIDRVETIHASDTAISGSLKHVLLGTGVAPYYSMFELLQHHGWNGWICMEEASFMGERGVEWAGQFISHAWETVTEKCQTEH